MTLDLGHLTQWYWSGAGDWFAFLGRYTFHSFHWRVRRDHNAEWVGDIENAKRLRQRCLAKAEGS